MIIVGQRYLKMFDQCLTKVFALTCHFICVNLISLERVLYGDSEYVSFIDSKWGVRKLKHDCDFG